MTPRPRLGITTPDWCICSDTPRSAIPSRPADPQRTTAIPRSATKPQPSTLLAAPTDNRLSHRLDHFSGSRQVIWGLGRWWR